MRFHRLRPGQSQHLLHPSQAGQLGLALDLPPLLRGGKGDLLGTTNLFPGDLVKDVLRASVVLRHSVMHELSILYHGVVHSTQLLLLIYVEAVISSFRLLLLDSGIDCFTSFLGQLGYVHGKSVLEILSHLLESLVSSARHAWRQVPLSTSSTKSTAWSPFCFALLHLVVQFALHLGEEVGRAKQKGDQ